MTPEHMRQIEDRRPAVRAGVQNSEQCLQESIQVHYWRCMATILQQIVTRVPPSMSNTGGQDRGFSGSHDDSLRPDLSAECSRFHHDLFVFTEMHVQGWTTRSWRQGAIKGQHDLSLTIAHAAHPQNLSRMAVLQLEKVIHDPSLLLAYVP
jgi:hypothetical protein